MLNLVGIITGILEATGGFFGESVAVAQLPEQQTTGIRGYLATLKIGPLPKEQPDCHEV